VFFSVLAGCGAGAHRAVLRLSPGVYDARRGARRVVRLPGALSAAACAEDADVDGARGEANG
jgi:hypothetical protein